MKNRSLSLTLVLSIALSGATPALNAMQTIKRGLARAMPAWTKGPGFTAAKKWWKAGRNVNALTPQEQAAFNTLKKRVAIGTIIAALTALLAGAAYGIKKQQQQKQAEQQKQQELGEREIKIRHQEAKFDEEVEKKLKNLNLEELKVLQTRIRMIVTGKERLPPAGFLPPFDRGFKTMELVRLRGKVENAIAKTPPKGSEVYIQSSTFDKMKEPNKAEEIKVLLLDYNNYRTEGFKTRILEKYNSLSPKDKELFKEGVRLLKHYKIPGSEKLDIQNLVGS